jgi:phosphoesterase RecJ-like protein
MMDERRNILQALTTCFKQHGRFVLVSHRNPDGDSIASQIATHLILEGMGKEVRMINRDPTPERYLFLPGSEKIEIRDSIFEKFDVAIFLECSDKERSGYGNLASEVVVNIDHHQRNSHFGDINWVEPNACSVGAMIFDLVEFLEIKPTREIATQIFTAIMTDTGSFHYTNTSDKALGICSKLMAVGIDHPSVIRHIYEDLPFNKIKLLGITLSTLERSKEGDVVWMRIPRCVFEGFTEESKETEGFIDFPRSIKGVRVAILIKEIGQGVHKISFRSRNEVDVSEIAKVFGGGGHRNAAGCTISGSYEEVLEKVQNLIQEQLHIH